MDLQQQGSFIWSVADILRGSFKQHDNGKIILPFTVLRRFDCILAPHKEILLELNKNLKVENKLPIFQRKTGLDFYNISLFDFEKLTDDSTNLEANLLDYINGYSDNIKEIMEHFGFFDVIKSLAKADLLYPVVQRFSEINIDDKSIDNLGMGYVFEELVRKFSEQSNETAGDHFTPREVIELMVEILLAPDTDLLQDDNRVVTLFDQTTTCLIQCQNKTSKKYAKINEITENLWIFSENIRGYSVSFLGALSGVTSGLVCSNNCKENLSLG